MTSVTAVAAESGVGGALPSAPPPSPAAQSRVAKLTAEEQQQNKENVRKLLDKYSRPAGRALRSANGSLSCNTEVQLDETKVSSSPALHTRGFLPRSTSSLSTSDDDAVVTPYGVGALGMVPGCGPCVVRLPWATAYLSPRCVDASRIAVLQTQLHTFSVLLAIHIGGLPKAGKSQPAVCNRLSIPTAVDDGNAWVALSGTLMQWLSQSSTVELPVQRNALLEIMPVLDASIKCQTELNRLRVASAEDRRLDAERLVADAVRVHLGLLDRLTVNVLPNPRQGLKAVCLHAKDVVERVLAKPELLQQLNSTEPIDEAAPVQVATSPAGESRSSSKSANGIDTEFTPTPKVKVVGPASSPNYSSYGREEFRRGEASPFTASRVSPAPTPPHPHTPGMMVGLRRCASALPDLGSGESLYSRTVATTVHAPRWPSPTFRPATPVVTTRAVSAARTTRVSPCGTPQPPIPSSLPQPFIMGPSVSVPRVVMPPVGIPSAWPTPSPSHRWVSPPPSRGATPAMLARQVDVAQGAAAVVQAMAVARTLQEMSSDNAIVSEHRPTSPHRSGTGHFSPPVPSTWSCDPPLEAQTPPSPDRSKSPHRRNPLPVQPATSIASQSSVTKAQEQPQSVAPGSPAPQSRPAVTPPVGMGSQQQSRSTVSGPQRSVPKASGPGLRAKRTSQSRPTIFSHLELQKDEPYYNQG